MNRLFNPIEETKKRGVTLKSPVLLQCPGVSVNLYSDLCKK